MVFPIGLTYLTVMLPNFSSKKVIKLKCGVLYVRMNRRIHFQWCYVATLGELLMSDEKKIYDLSSSKQNLNILYNYIYVRLNKFTNKSLF